MSAKERRKLKAQVDEKLDQALQDTFPASDPVSFIEPGPAKNGPRAKAEAAASRSHGKDKATRG